MSRQKVYIYSSILSSLLFILTVQFSYEWEQKLTLPPTYRLKGDLQIQQSRYTGQAGGRVIINPPLMDISYAQGSSQYGKRQGSCPKKYGLKDGVYHAQYKIPQL